MFGSFRYRYASSQLPSQILLVCRALIRFDASDTTGYIQCIYCNKDDNVPEFSDDGTSFNRPQCKGFKASFLKLTIHENLPLWITISKLLYWTTNNLAEKFSILYFGLYLSILRLLESICMHTVVLT